MSLIKIIEVSDSTVASKARFVRISILLVVLNGYVALHVKNKLQLHHTLFGLILCSHSDVCQWTLKINVISVKMVANVSLLLLPFT